jgi:hypothetical protein
MYEVCVTRINKEERKENTSWQTLQSDK